MSYNSSSTNGIPTVQTATRIPTARSSVSDRRFTELETAVTRLTREREEDRAEIVALKRKNEELDAKLKRQRESNKLFGFPGSEVELESLRQIVKRIEKRHVGVDGWNLGETLIRGPNNSKKVKAIVDDFFVDTEVLILTRNYVWLREDIQAFVKNKLTQRFKGLKVKESKSNLTDEELTAATLKNRYATRKNHILARRLDIFENQKSKLLDLSRPDEDYRALLISDMTSDREDGFDEFDKPIFIRKAPIYRSVECEQFFDQLDEIRHQNNKLLNPRYEAPRVSDRTYHHRPKVNMQDLQKLPAWGVDFADV